MTLSSLMNAAMTDQMRNTLVALDGGVTDEARVGARQTLLKQMATVLAKGPDKAQEAVDAFRRAEASDHQTAIDAYQKALLTPEQADTFIKICKDGFRNGLKPSPSDRSDREVYSQLLKDPESLANAKATHVQDDDTFEALTSPSKSKSDAAFERLNTRFRMNPDIDPNDMALTIANTFKTAERKGQVGSFVGKQQ